MSRNYAEIAHKYAVDVVNGVISANSYVKMACARHLADLEREDFRYVYNPVLTDNKGKEYRPGDRVCAFLEKLRHVKGKWKGLPFVLEPWQVFIVCVGFGWVDRHGFRRFREIYLEVPRKNGKSFLAAGIGLYMFLADGEGGSEVYAGANGERQANAVFKPAWQMCKQDPVLKNYYSVVIYGLKPDSGSLGTSTDYSKFERLVGNPKDGDFPSCYLCDEFHEHDTPMQYDTMSTGFGGREQPITLITTTAGVNKDGPCFEKRSQCINILKGTIVNEEIFCIIYTIDEGDNWKDLNSWAKANPNYNVSVFDKYFESKLLEAQQTLSKQAIILCKNLNVWMDSYNSWLDMELWRKCEDKSIVESDFINKYPCYYGADFGAVKDLTARVRIYLKDGKYYVFSQFNLPEGVANDPDKTNYLRWTQEGWIETNPGRTVDFTMIEDEVYDFVYENRMLKEFALDIGFSAWPFIQSLEKRLSQKRGKKFCSEFIIEYGKNVKNFSEPMKQLEKAIIDQKIVHNGNPVLNWCLGNVVVRVDKADNILATKERADSKIDGADALITAFARAMMHDTSKTSANDGSLL